MLLEGTPLRLTSEANRAIPLSPLFPDKPYEKITFTLLVETPSPPYYRIYRAIFPEETRGSRRLSSLQTLLHEGTKQTASQQQHRGTIKIKFTVNRTYSWGKTLTVSILIICKALGGRTSAPSQMTAAACVHLRQCGFFPPS